MYVSKLDYLVQMEKFLEKHRLPKQTRTEELNRPITSKQIESVIENIPKRKSLRSKGFNREFYQTFKKELISILLKVFQRVQEKGTLLK